MALLLEPGELSEHDDMPQMYVRRGRVYPELHPERVARGELFGELPLGEHLLRSAREDLEVSHA